ncbi:unnamed protein product, partial [Meganyctiphanes norvegica]
MDDPKILKYNSPIPSVPIPEYPNVNIAENIINRMKQHPPEGTAVINSDSGRSFTWGQLVDLIPRVSAGLSAAGVRIGDSVLLVMHNHIDFPVMLFAIQHAGALAVPCSPLLKAEDFKHAINLSDANWIVTDRKVQHLLEPLISSLPPGTIKQMWIQGKPLNMKGRPSLAALFKTRFSQPAISTDKWGAAFNAATTPAVMLFSSGTTGLPKGVLLSHQTENIVAVRSGYLEKLTEVAGAPLSRHTSLIMMPLYHSYGHLMLKAMLAMGHVSVLMAKFSPKAFFASIEKYKVSYCPLVPHIAHFLSETSLGDKYDLSSLKAFSTGSAALAPAVAEKLTNKTGVPTSQGYAMTETGIPVSHNWWLWGINPASIGKLNPWFEAKIVDIETGEILDFGKEGELCVKGPGIMMGYAKNPVATAATIDTQGWLHTGDLGYIGEEEFIFLTDRMKDLIKVKGYQM